MNSLKSTKNQQGFTIIEVLIVLAIAGVIMAIVFLAIPTLQRNSRNTQRRSDVAHLASLVSEYEANNVGSLPTAIGNLNLANENFSIIKAANITMSTTASGGTPAVAANTSSAVVDIDTKCTPTGAVLAYSSGSFAVSYKVETSGAPLNACVGG
jgi:prepilin-type N-terminal cleavage/methylation domain-containing protein